MTEPEWFNSADNFGAATQDALKCQGEVFELLGRPKTWGLDEQGSFVGGDSESHWHSTSKMRSAATIAARLGKRGFKPAMGLLRMALDPKHLGESSRGPSTPGTDDTALAVEGTVGETPKSLAYHSTSFSTRFSRGPYKLQRKR